MKRINRLFALSAAFLVLASQACNNSSPGGVKSGSQASSNLVVVPVGPVAGAISATLSPAALPGAASPLT